VLAAADHLPRPALHGRRALPGRHASIVKVKACGSVLSKNLLEGNSENPLEVEHVPIVRAELLLEGRPRNEGGLLRFDPVKALSKPSVDVERNSGMRQRRNALLKQGDSVGLQAVGLSGVQVMIDLGVQLRRENFPYSFK
jgi:hypothetical protein